MPPQAPAAPDTETADFKRGFNAALAAVAAGSSTTTPTKPPAVTQAAAAAAPTIAVGPTYLPDTASLADALNGSTDRVDLKPGATYALAVGAVDIKRTLAIHGNKSTIKLTRTPGSSTAIKVDVGGNVTAQQITFISDAPLATYGTAKTQINVFRTSAALAVADCTFTDIDDAIFFDDGSTGSAQRLTATRTIRGDLIYVAGAADVSIDAIESPGSFREHVIRVDSPNASNICITNCTLSNWDGKETIAIRNAGKNKKNPTAPGVTIAKNLLNAWMRLGQEAPDGQPPVALSVADALILGNRFQSRAYLQIDQGNQNAVVNANTFDNYRAYCAVHAAGPNIKATGTNNRLNPMGGQGPGILPTALAATDLVSISFI